MYVTDVRRRLFPSPPLSKPDLGFETFIGDLLGCIRDKNIPLQNMHFKWFITLSLQLNCVLCIYGTSLDYGNVLVLEFDIFY